MRTWHLNVRGEGTSMYISARGVVLLLCIWGLLGVELLPFGFRWGLYFYYF